MLSLVLLENRQNGLKLGLTELRHRRPYVGIAGFCVQVSTTIIPTRYRVFIATVVLALPFSTQTMLASNRAVLHVLQISA